MDRPPENGSEIYKTLSHPIRVNIIKFLYNNEYSSFSEITKAINVSDATLYYHLKILKRLITQDETLKYFLNEEGLGAYQLLTEGDSIVSTIASVKGYQIGKNPFIKNVVFPKWVFSYLYSSSLRNAIEIAILVLFFYWISSESGLSSSLQMVYYRPDYSNIIIFRGYILSWITLIGINGIIGYIISKKRALLKDIIGVSISRLPIIFFIFIWIINRVWELGFSHFLDGFFLRFIFLILQSWSLILLTLSNSISRELSVEKAAVITFVITYLDLAFYFSTQGF